MPKLIVIEGLDGSGKATQAKRLVQQLAENNQPALGISFPDYHSESSALVRMYLRGEIGEADDVNAYAASAFYAADRYISYVQHWREPYLAGKIIVADRYVTSNAVHQMAKLPSSVWRDYLDWLVDFEFHRMQLPAPDIVFYLDTALETSQALLHKRYGGDAAKQDIHERNIGYLARCREAAHYAGNALGWTTIPCCDHHGGILPIDTIAQTIWTHVQQEKNN